jgi:hypothetical protein
MKAGCFLVLLVLATPALAGAQGLGDAAAREREKRQKAAPAPGKSFTDSDLEKSKPKPDEQGGDSTAGESAGASDAAASKAEPGTGGKQPADPALDALERERQERKLQEAEWRVRFADAREQLALAEAACWHEVVRTEFYQGIPVQMKVKEFVESEEFRQAKQALADLEEQFRRTGLPPGWAREK